MSRAKIVIRPSVERINLSNQSWIDKGFISSIPYDFETLWNLHPLEYGKVKIWGKLIETPRWQQSYGRGYYFSGVSHPPLEIPPEFQPFLDWSNTLYPEWTFNQNAPSDLREPPGESYGITFNQILMNWYQDGSHYIGPHSDDESQLVDGSPIVSISLGQERTFRIRNRETKSIVLDLPMPNGSYLVMGGNLQKFYTHEVPKVGGKKGESLGRRINITLRSFRE